MKMAVEESRKGPWTEQEDVRLDYFVRLLGERRWDFIAKVSGLKRTGKSCRLRWVNYLNPGLKRGRMTPEEERLVLDLHSVWGNRWSRIARKLPGRTDNEIKNYWRTHMRKKAQERKRASSLPSSSSSSSSSCCSTTASDRQGDSYKIEEERMKDQGGCNELKGEVSAVEGARGWYSMDQIWKEVASSEVARMKKGCSSTSAISTTGVGSSLKYKIEEEASVEDKGGCSDDAAREEIITTEEGTSGGYSMDQIWEEIAASPEEVTSSGETHKTCQEKGCNFCCSPMASPLWGYCPDSLWSMNEEEIRKLAPMSDLVVSYYGHS